MKYKNLGLAALATLVALTTFTVPLAGPGRWHELARSEIEYAKELSSSHIRFGSEFIEGVTASMHGCWPIDYKVAALSAAESKQVRDYSNRYCLPWQNAWDKVFHECDRDPGPEWCKGGEAGERHLQFHAYFDTLTEELRVSKESLESFNIMAIVATRLDDTNNIFDHMPQELINTWLVNLAREYLKSAPPDDVMAIVALLDNTNSGYSEPVAQVFANSAEQSSAFTSEQKEVLRSKVEEAHAGQ